MAANGGHCFEWNPKDENYKTQFISQKQFDISKFLIFNNFLVYSLIFCKICTKRFGFRTIFILMMV